MCVLHAPGNRDEKKAAPKHQGGLVTGDIALRLTVARIESAYRTDSSHRGISNPGWQPRLQQSVPDAGGIDSAPEGQFKNGALP